MFEAETASSNLFRRSEPLRVDKLSFCLVSTLAFAAPVLSAGAARQAASKSHHPAAKHGTTSGIKAGVRSRGHLPGRLATRHAQASRAGHMGRALKHGAHSTQASPNQYARPLTPQAPLPLRSAPSDLQGDLPPDASGSGVPPEPAVPPAVEGGAVRSVAQQLSQGGTALQFPGALSGFFSALRRQESTSGAGVVRVMQFGDSHTAADMFTGEARARMQARFGDGGIGFSYAGHPFAGYRILGSGRGQTGGWTTLGTHFTQLGDAELGLGGVAIQSAHAGDSASLEAPCSTLQVQYLRQPGGGSMQVTDNGVAVATAVTDSGQTEPATTGSRDDVSAPQEQISIPAAAAFDSGLAGTLRHECTPGPHHFTLTALGDGPVRLLGTVTLMPGITWEALGINGAEAPLMLKWNQPLFRTLLAAAAPDLILLAYGTNEAAAHWGGEEYRATFARLIDMLHRTDPLASILVVGPADRSLGSTSYTVVGRGRRARRIAHRYFSPYSGTERIVSAQREVCSTHHCAFWNWQARQGGLGSMNRWVSAGYAQPDHTHFTAVGYHALADALVADLLSAYSGFIARAKTSN